jgi:hypothetical protein
VTAIPASIGASEATHAPEWTRRGRLALALGVSLIAGQHPATAQHASSHEVTAGFVYNFAKFTEWPEEVLPQGAPLILCIADSVRVVKALEAATGGQAVDGHILVIRTVDLDGKLSSCHLVYAGGVDARRGATLIETLKGASVLTLSDLDRFALRGGTANLFVEEGRMRFAVNLDAARRARLRLSSRLLALAKIVKEDPAEASPPGS